MQRQQVDRAILRKRIENDDAAGTVTIHVDLLPPTRSSDIPVRWYSAADARQWLGECKILVGEMISGNRVTNLDPRDCGKKVTGTWVFKVVEEVEPEAPVAAPSFAKVVSTKEKVSTNEAEFEGLNYDGDTKPEKTTSKRKTKAKKQRK